MKAITVDVMLNGLTLAKAIICDDGTVTRLGNVILLPPLTAKVQKSLWAEFEGNKTALKP